MAVRTPTLADALSGALESRLSDVFTALPGRVESYNSSTRRANVKPLIKRATTDEEGNRVAESLPVVTDVPVMFPGSGGVRVSFPVAAGEVVLLVFASASIDKWLDRGGEVDPLTDRRHSLSDAIAIPGLLAHASDADPMIKFTSNGQIHAGGSDALATKADIDDLRSYIVTHVHPAPGGTTSAPTGPVPSAAGTTVLKGS